jgi:cell division protein FtsI/penicillin-binding protein 2
MKTRLDNSIERQNQEYQKYDYQIVQLKLELEEKAQALSAESKKFQEVLLEAHYCRQHEYREVFKVLIKIIEPLERDGCQGVNFSAD